MQGDDDFARALSDFLALHTLQSSGHLYGLINSFLRGAAVPRLDHATKNKIVSRLKAEVATHSSAAADVYWPMRATQQNERISSRS